MAVSRIGADDAEQESSSTSGSFSHTTSSGTDVLVVYLTIVSGATEDPSVTWNGTAMTRQVDLESETNQFGGAVFYLSNPDIGTYTLAWDTGAASLSFDCVIIAHSYQGADGTIVDSDNASTTSADQALSITFTGGASGDMMCGVASDYQTANGVSGNGQTLLNDLLTADGSNYTESFEKAWGADNDLATTDSDYGCLMGIVLQASAAGGATGKSNPLSGPLGGPLAGGL